MNKKYLNDFKLMDDDITYEYVGDVYYLKGDISDIRKKLIMLASLLMVSSVVSGLLPYEGMTGHATIIIPYIVEVGFAMLICYITYSFLRNISELRAYQKESIYDRYRPYAFICTISAIMSCVGSILLFFTNGFNIWGILYLFVQIFAVFILKLIMDMTSSLDFSVKKGKH